MKNVFIILAITILSACASVEPKKVNIEVWTPPKVELPVKPTLKSDGVGTDGVVARKLSNDLVDMVEYTKKLENILQSIFPGTQNLENNK